MNESKYFFRKIKHTNQLLIGLGIIILSILLELYVVNNYRSEVNSAVKYMDAAYYGQYVYIDVKDYSDMFATYGNDESEKSIYFVKDDQYVYIAAMKDSTLKKLPSRIYGYTHTIPDDLKDIAIDVLENEEINEDTFYDYLGMYYVDAYEAPTGDLIAFSIILGIALFVGIGFIISYLLKNKHTKKLLESYGIENIKQEIDSSSTVANHLGKTYLTSKNIISYCNELLIINLNDIIWIYPHTLRYNGHDYNSLVAADKTGKTKTITSYSAANKKAKQSFDEFYQSIMTRNNNILYGYTAENKEKVDQIIKNRF